MTDWQPIDTFPLIKEPWADGREHKVLITNGTEIQIGYAAYEHDFETGEPTLCGWRLEGEGWEFSPSHWMELPPLNKPQAAYDR